MVVNEYILFYTGSQLLRCPQKYKQF